MSADITLHLCDQTICEGKQEPPQYEDASKETGQSVKPINKPDSSVYQSVLTHAKASVYWNECFFRTKNKRCLTICCSPLSTMTKRSTDQANFIAFVIPLGSWTTIPATPSIECSLWNSVEPTC